VNLMSESLACNLWQRVPPIWAQDKGRCDRSLLPGTHCLRRSGYVVREAGGTFTAQPPSGSRTQRRENDGRRRTGRTGAPIDVGPSQSRYNHARCTQPASSRIVEAYPAGFGFRNSSQGGGCDPGVARTTSLKSLEDCEEGRAGLGCQVSGLRSQFSVLRSQFSDLGSQISVLSSQLTRDWRARPDT